MDLRLGGHTYVCLQGSSQYEDSRGGGKKEGAPVGCRGLGSTSLSLYITEQNTEEFKSSQIKPGPPDGSIGIFIKLEG